jgi:hypothetical protein
MPGLYPRADLRDRLLNGGLHLRVLRIAGKAHVGAEIRRADKHAVDAFHIEDLRQIFQRLAGFNLHQHAHGVVGLMEIIRNAVPARGARQRAADAANARGRVAGGSTASRASSAFCTIGTSRVCAPTSSSCLICTGSFHDGRTTGWLG